MRGAKALGYLFVTSTPWLWPLDPHRSRYGIYPNVNHVVNHFRVKRALGVNSSVKRSKSRCSLAVKKTSCCSKINMQAGGGGKERGEGVADCTKHFADTGRVITTDVKVFLHVDNCLSKANRSLECLSRSLAASLTQLFPKESLKNDNQDLLVSWCSSMLHHSLPCLPPVSVQRKMDSFQESIQERLYLRLVIAMIPDSWETYVTHGQTFKKNWTWGSTISWNSISFTYNKSD